MNDNIASMFSDLVCALRTRWVQATLVFSFILRLVFHVFFLPNKPSSFGPDEGTYGLLAEHVAEGKPMEEFPYFGPALYNQTRSLIVPSSMLIRFGLSGLESVRLISSIYGLLSTLAIILCLLVFLQIRYPKKTLNNCGKKIVFPVLLFTFFPSNFLWSTLGLRESASQFWLIATFYFLLKILTGKTRVTFLSLFSPSLCLVFAFGARKETALVATMLILITGSCLAIKRRNVSILVVAAIGLIGGQMFTATPQIREVETFDLIPIKAAESNNQHPLTKISSNACSSERERVTFQSVEYICKKSVRLVKSTLNPIRSTQSQVESLKFLEAIRKVRSVDAQSALPESNCRNYSNQLLSSLVCNLKELPFRLSSFLLRPFPLIDSGSSFYNLAALENVAWLILFLLILTLMLKVKSRNCIVVILTFYAISFSALASLHEGNLGTAFRHKSSILWSLSIILSVLLFQEKKTSGRKSIL